MKTIELKAGQQIAQFTTKSVTFDGKEFFYSRMSNLTHDPATQKYYFTYDGESKILPYEAKDAQILTAIFSQVLKLQAAKAAQAHAAKMPAQTTQQTPQAPVQDQAQQEEIPVTPQTPHAVDVRAAAEMAQPAPEPAEQAPVAEQAPAAGQATAAEQASAEEPIVFTDKKAAKQAEKERKKAEKAAKRAEKERLKAEKAAKKAGKVTEPETPAEGGSQAQETGAQTSDLIGTPAESAAEPKELTDEEKTAKKKTKLKKSLLIFAAVLVIVAALSVAAYFIFGTSNNPSSNNPGSKESQQYDDIDELINDLQ